MTKHTPGPWKWEYRNHAQTLWGQGRVLTIVQGVIPMEPDARLIAQAPAMYSLLRAYLRTVGKPEDLADCDTRARAILCVVAGDAN